MDFLSNVDMLTMSEVIVAKRITNNLTETEWILIDVYKVSPDYPLNLAVFGSLSNAVAANIQLLVQPATAPRRENLQGITIPCALTVSQR